METTDWGGGGAQTPSESGGTLSENGGQGSAGRVKLSRRHELRVVVSVPHDRQRLLQRYCSAGS